MKNITEAVSNYVSDEFERAKGFPSDLVNTLGNQLETTAGNIGTIGNLAGGLIGGVVDTTVDATKDAVVGVGDVAKDVYGNTVSAFGRASPSTVVSGIGTLGNLANVPGLSKVATPVGLALGFMEQGQRDKDLGIKDPSLLGRLARSFLPGPFQRPVLDFMGVTEAPDPFGGYGSPEAQEEGVAGIDTGSTGGDATYDVGAGGQPVDTSQVTTYGGSEFGFDPDPDQRGPDQAQVDANISRSRSLETMDWDESDTDTDTSTDTSDTGDFQDPDDIDYGYDEEDWAKGGAVGFDTGGMAVGRFGAYMGDEDDAAELAQVSAEQQNIQRFDEADYSRDEDADYQLEQFIKHQQELEPGERLFSQTASPETRTSSFKVVIPPGSFNRIPVGIEVLQNFQRQQLTAWPDEVMKRHKLKQQAMKKNKQTVLKGIFNISKAGKFMTDTLIKPEQLRASLIKAEQETTDEFARKFKNVQKSLGLGTTFTLSPRDLNAIVNADLIQGPNFRNFSGNVRIPLSGDTTVNVGAQRNLIEGGQDFNTYEAGVNTKLGIGNLGINYKRNPRENYFGATFNMPLN
jgi:hypothetical protein